MGSLRAVGIACILFAILNDVKQVCSQPRLRPGGINQSPTEATKLQEDIQKVIDQIHSVSNRKKRSANADPTEEAVYQNSSFGILNNLYGLFQPLMTQGYMDNLPQTLVCILSERQDCGQEAELTKTVSREFGQPMLATLLATKSQTCSRLSSSEGTSSFSGTYFNITDTLTSWFGSFKQTFISMLTNLPLSEDLMNIVSGLLDSSATYALKFVATLVETPTDYADIALQLGIKVPTINEEDTCSHGDLKQLIMWGLKHNVSWSFSPPLIDILLKHLFPPNQLPYMFPGQNCQNSFTTPLQGSASTMNDYNLNYKLDCANPDLASLKDTLCADVLVGSGDKSSASLLAFCQALSSLSSSQIELVWSNMCFIIELVVSSLIHSPDCAVEATMPPPLVTSLYPSSPASHQVGRGISNLQPSCNYSTWSGNSAVNPDLVSLCSINDRAGFVKQVCNNSLLMKKLLSDQMNVWLYGYCASSPVDPGFLVSQFCVYDQWLAQPSQLVDPALLGFCLSLDQVRLTNLICNNVGFLMLLFSNPGNWQLMPNCSNSPPPTFDPAPMPLDFCQYSTWHDVMQITTDIASQCILFDQAGFTSAVCANKTFLNALLLNKDLSWLGTHCSTALPPGPTTQPPTMQPPTMQPPTTQQLNWAAWCDYHTWGQRQVDDSFVALCWQNDQAAFFKNVCCVASVIENLLQNPLNQWLSVTCTNVQEIAITVTPQMCNYTAWASPIIVDMTEVALCSEEDPLNFTSKVCVNITVLQNLLANQDNHWLANYCANHSTSPPGGGGGAAGAGGAGGAGAGGQGGGQTAFNTSVFNTSGQCLYSSWIMSPPNAMVLSQCWERDQARFLSFICQSSGLLWLFSQDLSKAWVSRICTTYNNYTTTTNSTNATSPDFCLATNLMKQFKWTCPNSFISDCQPCATQNMMVQMIVRCWVENLSLKIEDLLTTSVTKVLNQAVATTVVILLAVEDSLGPIWHINETIGQSVLESVFNYLMTEPSQDNKRVVLQCFGMLIGSLLQTARELTTNDLLFAKEYFSLPLSNVKPVLTSAQMSTIRLILQYYSMFKSSLQLPDAYLSTMVSVLLQTQMTADGKTFLELVPLLVAASPADIVALPPLQDDRNVKDAISKMLDSMSQAQKDAFGQWYSKSLTPANITSAPKSLINDTGNLMAYLPFQTFQYLSAAQLLGGLDVLQRNTLSPLKQEFIANQLTRTYKNLTAQDFMKLGNLTCLADQDDLLVYKNTSAFPVIQDAILNCTLKGVSMPSQMISTFVLNNPELQVPSSLSADRLAQLAVLLPTLGVTFLQGLTGSQLLGALPALSSVSFTPAQATVILDKLPSSTILQDLGSLILGLKTETLLTFTSDKLLSVLKALSKNKQANCQKGLHPPEANAIATKLWGFPEVVSWLNDVAPLLSCTPLLSVMPRTHLLALNASNTTRETWNTQQAEAIFNDLFSSNPNLVKQNFLSLGSLGQGVSCKVLQDRFRADPTPSSATNILAILRQQPRLLHTALKNCVIEGLYPFDFFTQLLQDFGVEIALSMSMSTFSKFSPGLMDTLRKMIVENPSHFLVWPATKQLLLVDRMLQTLGMYTGTFTKEEFLSLGVMASFVADEVFIQVDRSFFIQNLHYIKSLCYSSSKMDIVSRILQEPAVFGSVKNWTQVTLSQVERFVFFLPVNVLQDIPLPLMTVGQIEKLFMSQRQWEGGVVGTFCSDQNDRAAIFSKKQFVLQFFLGFLTMSTTSLAPKVPTCEILRTTAPSAWTSGSLSSMPTSAFINCLELMGLDSFMASYQRSEVLKRVKKIFGPVSSFPQSLISQLGGIATALTADELSTLQLTDVRSISSLGAVSNWTSKQLTALFTTVLNATKKSASQLDSSTLVAMGHIVCGAKTTDINSFNNVEFSKAVLYLGQLKLPCSEDQMLALNMLLTNPLAFGLISSWDTDVFIEIGVLAAGLPDMAMSALVKVQIDGISPAAISMILPDKFAVVFDQKQISWFSYEQAVAVTPQQIALMSDAQKAALAVVLTPWYGKPTGPGVRSLGSSLSHSPLCLMLGLLILLTFQFCPDR